MASCSFLLTSILLISYTIDIIESANVISCLGNNCRDTIIDCQDGEDCFVSCSSPNACQNTIINCPSNQHCVILCEDMYSCYGSTFKATHSETLEINGCNSQQSCLDLTIYCPPYTRDINCDIQGNDNLGSDMTIYAVNGWNDIGIDYNGTFENNLTGTMYCDIDYDISCPIASDKWSCMDDNNSCNNILMPKPTTTITTNSNASHMHTTTIDTEMIIIICTLNTAFCFICLCCYYNNHNRSPDKNNINQNQNVSAIANTTDTNVIEKTAINNDTGTVHANTRNNYNKGEKTIDNHNHIHMSHHQSQSKHKYSPKPYRIATHTHTHVLSTQPSAAVHVAVPVEIITDINAVNINIVHKAQGSDISMVVQNGYKNEYNEHKVEQKLPYVDTNINKQPPPPQQQQQQNDNIDSDDENESENDKLNHVSINMNPRNKRRKDKEIQNISAQNEQQNASNENELTIINEQQATPTIDDAESIDFSNYIPKKNQKREQLQIKPTSSDSEPLCMKAPDTWDNFEKENGILDDQFNMSQMMGYLEEGAIACSYE